MSDLKLWLAFIVCLMSGGSAAFAGTGTEDAWPLEVRARLLRLADVDWRLRVAAGDLCPRNGSAIGVTIDQMAAYPPDKRQQLARVLRLGNLPQIAAVAAASPADRAGLRPGDQIVSLNGVDMARSYEQSSDPALFADEVMDSIASLPAGQSATVVIERGGASLRKTIVPVTLCAARTLMETRDALDAHSDERDLAITSSLVEFTANDDELALIVGHELAHVIQHKWHGAQLGDGQETEREADLVGAALAHCAGYDVARAADFWPRYRAQDAKSALRMPTHPLPEQREQAIRAATPSFACPVSSWAELSTL